MIVVSIVVPVYKVEQYLDICVQSLINQTYRNIEIILVDDGSPDKCPQMCDLYAEIDERIKVIHKENGGLSDARNAGIKHCCGDYVLFVDSDDFIEINSVEKLVGVINGRKPDIVVGNAIKLSGNSKIPMKHTYYDNSRIIKGKEYLKLELKNGTMHMAAWLNMYRLDFLKKNSFEFKVGLLHEDEQFTPRVFLEAERVIGTDIVFYNYLIREGSITTSNNKIKNALHLISTCNELDKIYNQVSDPELKVLLKDNLVNKYLNAFQIGKLYKKDYKHAIDKEFLKNKAYKRKNKIKVALFCINMRLYYYINKASKTLKM